MIIITKYRLGDKKEFKVNGKQLNFTFHSQAYSEKSKKLKKDRAKNKGYLMRSVKEDTNSWSLWTRKHR